MKTMNRLRQLKEFAGSPQFLLAGWLGAHAATASARAQQVVPEPSLLSLVGAAAVAGIIAYRIKKKK